MKHATQINYWSIGDSSFAVATASTPGYYNYVQ